MNQRFISPKNILLRLPNWFGDAVMAAPTIDAICKQFPKSKITLLGLGKILELYKEHPRITATHALTKEKPLTEVAKTLRAEKYDLGILLTNSFSSAFLFWLSKVKVRIGFAKDMRTLFLTKGVSYPKSKTSEHMIQTYGRLSNYLGSKSLSSPKLILSPKEIEDAKEDLRKIGLQKDSILIGLHTEAAFGPSKCWPRERYKALSEKLLENPKVFLIFFGDEKCMDKVNEICLSLTKRTINMAGRTTIRKLMAYIHACDLFLTNDSGPMHIACALGVRTLAIFGSTSPEATGPYNQSKYIYKKVACSPCFKRECPIDFRCMKNIEVGEVYDMLQEQLRETPQTICP